MSTTVARLYRFRATHSLPDFPEPWCFLHQHDYTVEIVAKGGWDTDDLDRIWEAYAPTAKNLNDWCDPEPSTVESLAVRFLRHFGSHVVQVTVWEDQQRWGRAER